MEKQKTFHAYDKSGSYVVDVVATQKQFADEYPDLVAGEKPPAPITSTDPRDYNLTPRQFNRFAALHGYDDAIENVLSVLKSTDRETYAQIKGDVMGAKVFRFDAVLAVVGNPRVEALIPDGVDVTEETMSERWMIAKDY